MKRAVLFLLLINLVLCGSAWATEMVKLDPRIKASVAELNIELPDRFPVGLDQQDRRVWPAQPKAMAPWPTVDWTTSEPEAQGMDRATLIDAFRYAIGKSSRAVVVIRNGYLVGEWYGQGWNQNTTQLGYSMSKSYTSALFGMLLEDGVFTGLDQPAAEIIPEWDDGSHDGITIKNLLSMNSGLEYNFLTDALLVVSPNQNNYAIGLGMEAAPGTKWLYHNAACQVPSELVKRATGQQIGVFGAQRLASVIGMSGAFWDTDQVGNTLTYSGVHASAREFAKFGYLFLRRGEWDGQQLISEDWVVESTSPSQAENPFYGYLWWLNTAGLAMPNCPADAFAALGLFERRTYVVPSLDLVAIRLGPTDGGWSDNAFLGRVCGATDEWPVKGASVSLLAEKNLPAGTVLTGIHPNPFNPATTISFELPQQQNVDLRIFDVSGRLVRVLASGQTMSAGQNQVTWHGRDDAGRTVPAGVYFLRMDAGAFSQTERMTLVK